MPSHQVTDLDLFITVPWQDHFKLGQGINALTGKPAGRALEHIEPLQPADLDHQRTTGNKSIHNLHDQHLGIGVNTNATINLGFPVTLGAKFDYNHLSADSLSSYFVEYWIDGQYGLECVDERDLKLTPEAKEYVGDPARFRERYGDYFICGYRRHYSFRCIVKYKEESNMRTQDIDSGANVGIGGLLELGGNASRSRSSEKVSGVENVYSSCYGCFPTSSAASPMPFETSSLEHASKIGREVENLDFAKRPGVRHIALLQHYSALDKSLPRNVSVDGKVFSHLHRMDSLYMDLKLDLSHPAIDIHDIPDARDALSLFKDGRDTFVDDHDARATASQKLESATGKLKKFLDLSSHRTRIERLLLKNSPPKALKTGKPPTAFGYGLAHDEEKNSNKQCRPVKLEHGLDGWECLLTGKDEGKEWKSRLHRHYKTDLHFRGPSTRSNTQSRTEYSPSFRAVIVGFTLSCDNKPDESVSFTITTGGILSRSLSVQVSAPFGREWHCRVFFIEDEFGCLASHNLD